MNKFVFGVIMFLMVLGAVQVNGQEWHTMNQATIAWDAVTEMQGGELIPETDIVEYKVHLANATTDPDKTNPAEIGTTAETTYTITLNTEGKFFVGLQTLRMTSDRTSVSESVIGWSDDPEIAKDGNIFGLRYFVPPLPPCNVRVTAGN